MGDREMRLIFIPIIILTATIVIADAFPMQQSLNNQTKSSNTNRNKRLLLPKLLKMPILIFLKRCVKKNQ